MRVSPMPVSVWLRTFLFVVAALVVNAAQAAALPAPHQVVDKATKDVLARIDSERAAIKKDPNRVYVIIEENLVPYVDFDRIAKRIMAKHYQEANDAQRAGFRDVFKKSLIRAYGSALAKYDNQKFVVLTPRPGDVEKDRASVNMEVTMNDGSVYRVTYSMFLNDKGEWKLENLVLEGINLGQTYRNNFNELYQQNGGSIDKVISGWSSKVESTDNAAKNGGSKDAAKSGK